MSNNQARRERVRERLPGDVVALLVTEPANVRYLTGFTGSNGQLLLGADSSFFTDGRYQEQSAVQVPDLERHIYSGSTKFSDLLAKSLADRGFTKLGVEASHMTVAGLGRMTAALDGIELVPTTDLVEGVRERKDAQEIDAIRRAQVVAERAVTTVLREWRSGTELELALALEWAIRTGGGEGVSFDVIVATGPHSALPHAEPRNVPADVDGVLLIDIGARVDGYCSDMTRTYLGPQAPDGLHKVHAAVMAALEAGCQAVRPGVACADVDKAARDVLESAGYGEYFIHSTGHGVGLEIHEGPTLTTSAEGNLEPGMVVTVEPGVYLPGVGGVRIEDFLVVTEDGADNLTKLDRGASRPN
ncbi:MAG: Xaa-Pro peptidase family protein [Actinomycetota bacterium]